MSKEEMAMIPKEVDRSPPPSRPSGMVVDDEKDGHGSSEGMDVDRDQEEVERIEEPKEEEDESHTEIDIASFLE